MSSAVKFLGRMNFDEKTAADEKPKTETTPKEIVNANKRPTRRSKHLNKSKENSENRNEDNKMGPKFAEYHFEPDQEQLIKSDKPAEESETQNETGRSESPDSGSGDEPNEGSDAQLDDDESDANSNNKVPKRGPGRPRKVKLGGPGRPKKVYQEPNTRVAVVEEKRDEIEKSQGRESSVESTAADYAGKRNEEFVYTAEVSMDEALNGPDSNNW